MPPELALLKTQYIYDLYTGQFFHNRNSGRARKGCIARTLRPDGYIKIFLNGKSHLAHRLAWFYVYGTWPSELDHKNGVRSDNRIENLREATRGQNNGNSLGWAQERRRHKLPRGVYHYAQCPGRYRAQIVVNRKQIHLGCFSSIEAAEKAYKKAAHQHFREFVR